MNDEQYDSLRQAGITGSVTSEAAASAALAFAVGVSHPLDCTPPTGPASADRTRNRAERELRRAKWRVRDWEMALAEVEAGLAAARRDLEELSEKAPQ